jgi:hypothetical protein
LVEDVLKEMKRVLRDHLTQELDKQNVHAADGIVCDPVLEDNIILGDETPPNYGLPAIVIRTESSETSQWATGKKDVNYDVTIAVATTDTTEDSSQKKLWRTIRAIETCFEVYLPGRLGIIDYKTISVDYKASIFEIDENSSVEKGGIMQAKVLERLDAYTATQI